MYSAHWRLGEEYRRQFPDVVWRLEKKLPESDNIWHEETAHEYSAASNHLLVSGVSLDPGYTYRVAIKFCVISVCALPVHSNGVTILHRPPSAGSMDLSYRETETGSEINVFMARFYDPDVPVLTEAYEAIDRYEWCLTDNAHDSQALTQWTPLDTDRITIGDKQVKINIMLQEQIDFSKCRRLAVKGYNKLEIYTIISADIRNCSAIDPAFIVPSVVIDAVGYGEDQSQDYPVLLEKNNAWHHVDADYTSHRNMLSAVWPTLRHRNYTWAVVAGDKIDPTSHYKRENIMTLTDPCAMPDVIQCGNTDKEYVNIAMATPLQHGARYFICIHATPRHVENEKWSEELQEVNACSDGITVDITPPRGGRVFIGSPHMKQYQTSTSEVDVYWDSFTDVEEEEMSPHSSGISHYEVALGTTPGGNDVRKARSVGLVNHIVFHGLNLHDGNSIYATVIALDFVNKTTAAVSHGLTIDSTPPRTTGRQISMPGQYITDLIFEVCWDSVFVDPESGISDYEVAVGSRPGREDVLQSITLIRPCHVFDVTGLVQDGQVIYVSIKGYNNAGQHIFATPQAVRVATSAPRSGYVYDGKKPAVDEEEKDKDFITNITEMGAHWDGFADPHSSISHYLLRVGSCPGCADVSAKQNIGTKRDITFGTLHFTQGIRYYVAISACNMAGLCSTSVSDGMIFDPTPPVIGEVADGTHDRDIQFQGLRTFLGCKWRGFFDPESGLHHYEWRVGTSPGGEDILSAQNAALGEVAFHTLPRDQKLPVGQRLYTTVRAFNKAGLYNEVTSNGFLVDITPPTVERQPAKVNDLETANTSFSRSALSVEWEFKDDESSTEHHYISMSSHQLGNFKSSTLKVFTRNTS